MWVSVMMGCGRVKVSGENGVHEALGDIRSGEEDAVVVATVEKRPPIRRDPYCRLLDTDVPRRLNGAMVAFFPLFDCSWENLASFYSVLRTDRTIGATARG